MKLTEKKFQDITVGEGIKLTIGATIASVAVAGLPFVITGIIGFIENKKPKKKH